MDRYWTGSGLPHRFIRADQVATNAEIVSQCLSPEVQFVKQNVVLGGVTLTPVSSTGQALSPVSGYGAGSLPRREREKVVRSIVQRISDTGREDNEPASPANLGNLAAVTNLDGTTLPEVFGGVLRDVAKDAAGVLDVAVVPLVVGDGEEDVVQEVVRSFDAAV